MTDPRTHGYLEGITRALGTLADDRRLERIDQAIERSRGEGDSETVKSLCERRKRVEGRLVGGGR